MSIIESALQKLRRTSAAAGTRDDATAGPVGAIAGAAPAFGAAAPAAGYALKRMTLDTADLCAAGYLPEHDDEHRLADYYRRIKRPLIEKALAPDATPDMRLIIVSSALPGEGKTFTSINLALSMAQERDVSVLLVDADVPKKRISEMCGVRREPGLVDAVMDESLDVESLILRTDVRGLDILAAGRSVDNATELLASTRMAQIAVRLGARNPRRLIVLDAPPLLVSSEARALVMLPAQVVLVVRSGVTTRRAILDAIAQVDTRKLRGLILNDTALGRGDRYYRYSDYAPGGGETSGGA